MLKGKIPMARLAGILAVCLAFAAAAAATPTIFRAATFPMPGSRYDSMNGTGYDAGAAYDTEIVSMSLTGPVQLHALPAPGDGMVAADSFFDVFVESHTGPRAMNAGSFFDVFVEVDVKFTIVNTSVDPVANPQTFDTEMVSLNLQGLGDDPQMRLQESPGLPSRGKMTVTDLSDGTFMVDSFFDVFTELSVDGGQTWAPAHVAILMDGKPEPGTVSLLVLGGLALLRRRRSGKPA